jgi:DNA-binding beta-propeller fold protein YncE
VFSQTIAINGLTLDVEANNAGTRAYVASTFDPESIEGIAVVNLGTGAVIDRLRGAVQDNMFAVALSPDEQHLFVGTGFGVQRIDLSTGAATVLAGVSASVTAFSRHPSAPRLYGNMGYASVVEIDSENGNVLRTFNQAGPNFGTLQGTAVSPDGTRLYAALEGGDLLSWDLETGAPGPQLTSGGGFGLAVSPDGSVLYVARGADVLIVDRASLALLKTVAVGGFARRVAVRPDGVAVVSNESGWVDFIK